MARMKYTSRAFDLLPKWAQFLVLLLGTAAGVYGIAHYGWTFILKAIFAPVP